MRVVATDGQRFYFGWSDGKTAGVSVYDADTQNFERIGTDAHNRRGEPVALAVDDESVYVQIHYGVYFLTPHDFPLPDGPRIYRIRKRW